MRHAIAVLTIAFAACGRPDAEDPSKGFCAHPVSAWVDADGDGYGNPGTVSTVCDTDSLVLLGNDCDDNDDTVSPGATEVCDGRDEDCDGTPDDGAPGAAYWYDDEDGDGYGNFATEELGCAADGRVEEGTDCDDEDAAVHPGGEEICDNGLDDDCDGYECRVEGGW